MTSFKRDLVTQKEGNDTPLEPQQLGAYDSPKLNDHLESIRFGTVTFSRTGPSFDPTAEVRAHTHRSHSSDGRANKLGNCEIRDINLCRRPVAYNVKVLSWETVRVWLNHIKFVDLGGFAIR